MKNINGKHINGNKPIKDKPVADDMAPKFVGELFEIPYRDKIELEAIVEGMMVGYATAISDSLAIKTGTEKRLFGRLVEGINNNRKTAQKGVTEGIRSFRNFIGDKIKADNVTV